MVRTRRNKKRLSVRERKRRIHIMRRVFMVGVLTVLGLLFYGLWMYVHATPQQITSIEVFGGDTVPHAVISSIVEDELSGAYFFVVPKRFVYTYPEEAIRIHLQDVPKVAQVSISLRGRVLYVTYNEHHPYALWCADSNKEEWGETSVNCVYITQNGYAFTEAPLLTGGLYIRFIVENMTPKYGDIFPYDSVLMNLNEYKEMFKYFYISALRTVRYTKDNDCIFVFSDGAQILTGENDSIEFIKERIKTIFAMEEYKTLAQEGFVKIDLRFGNRVYVQKEKDIEGESDTMEIVDDMALPVENEGETVGE